VTELLDMRIGVVALTPILEKTTVSLALLIITPGT
jgi:hypothetical protein